MIDRMTDTTITERDVFNKMKGRDRLLTTLLWFVYLYLWMPFISLVAWYLGYEFAYEKVIKAGGIDSLLQLLVSFSMIVGVVMIIVIGWSMNQFWRFGGKDRRSATSRPDPDAEMAMWNIDETLFTNIRNAKNMTLNIDEEEVLTWVETGGRPRKQGA
jgi:poly-beta-1,6-N-acetyl-D-glucosamine biosynthesis protein PgaD